MSENQVYTPSEKVQKLYERREELLLARDILALQLEVRELKEQLKTNGNTDSEEREG